MNHYIDTNNKLWGFDETQISLIPADAVKIPDTYAFSQYPYLTLVDGVINYDAAAYDAAIEAEQLAACKTKAQSLLAATDWVTLSDITTGSPKLTNQADFLAYRSAVRSLAVNPITSPNWPVLPTEQWSS